MSPSVGKDANFQSWHRWQRQIPSMPLAIPDPLGPHTSGGAEGAGTWDRRETLAGQGSTATGSPATPHADESFPSRSPPARSPALRLRPQAVCHSPFLGSTCDPSPPLQTNVVLRNVSRKYAFCFLSSSNVIPLAQTVSAEPKWLASDLVAWAPGP